MNKISNKKAFAIAATLAVAMLVLVSGNVSALSLSNSLKSAFYSPINSPIATPSCGGYGYGTCALVAKLNGKTIVNVGERDVLTLTVSGGSGPYNVSSVLLNGHAVKDNANFSVINKTSTSDSLVINYRFSSQKSSTFNFKFTVTDKAGDYNSTNFTVETANVLVKLQPQSSVINEGQSVDFSAGALTTVNGINVSEQFNKFALLLYGPSNTVTALAVKKDYNSNVKLSYAYTPNAPGTYTIQAVGIANDSNHIYRYFSSNAVVRVLSVTTTSTVPTTTTSVSSTTTSTSSTSSSSSSSTSSSTSSSATTTIRQGFNAHIYGNPIDFVRQPDLITVTVSGGKGPYTISLIENYNGQQFNLNAPHSQVAKDGINEIVFYNFVPTQPGKYNFHAVVTDSTGASVNSSTLKVLVLGA